jgi:hypothetical protein
VPELFVPRLVNVVGILKYGLPFPLIGACKYVYVHRAGTTDCGVIEIGILVISLC